MGKYWYNDQVEAQTFLVKGGYAVSGAASEFFEWAAAKEGGGDLFYGRDLPARLLTDADKAAWRRAGSSKGPTYQGYGSRTELIFSQNGEYLGSRDVLTRPGGEYRTQRLGFTISFWVSRKSGWTNTKPTPPTRLPY